MFAFAFVFAVATQPPLLTIHALSLDTARIAADAALRSCRAEGFRVAVAVADRDGELQVLERDDFGGVHLIDTVRRKAFTAASSGARTSVWEKAVAERTGVPDPNIVNVRDVLTVGGGVPIRYHGEVIGAIAVAGSPGVQFDDACADAGIAAIADALR